MYNLPELYQSKDLNPVDAEKLDVIMHENVSLWKSDIPCDHDFYDLCILVMEENNLQPQRHRDSTNTFDLWLENF